MPRFSERYGYTSVRDVMQLEGMDKELKNGLWSVFFELIASTGDKGNYWVYEFSEYYGLLVNLWKRFYKLPIDKIPLTSYAESLEFVRKDFLDRNGLRFTIFSSLLLNIFHMIQP